VSTAILTSPRSSAELTKGDNRVSNQQKIEINVTGDVSRQTRNEITRMIPNISAGVNMWNRENA
jgi:hypothetical protein